MPYTVFNTPLIKSILRGVSLFFLKTLGWKEIGPLPEKAKYLIIVAPHTSNWDVFYGVILAFALKLDARFLAKKELFRWPFSPLVKWLGGLPIDRALPGNVVDRMIHEFEANEKFILAIAPEGTRHKASYWKSGFYRIAEGAHIPIQLAFIDYASKTGGVGPLVYPTGDIDQDMNAIRDFYLTVKGRHPDQTSPAAIRPQK